jgi:glyoxylase-like metal-dependent hydrolase (beta-lactamase superfamily II)
MSATETITLPDYAPIPRAALGPALNEQGYYVGRVERNLYYVTDGTYMSAFLTTSDGVVVLDAPPTIGNNIQRAIDEIATANGVSNKVEYLIYSHHHSDHVGAASLFDKNATRIGHGETRKLLLRDDDPARPPNEETFQDQRSLEIGGERIDLAWHGPNHSPDNIFIHLPDHDTLMLVDIVNPGWVPIYQSNLSEDILGYIEAPANALAIPGSTSSAATWAGSARETISPSTSSTWPTSPTAPGRRSTPSTRLPTSSSRARTSGRR